MSKAAVDMMTRCASVDLAKYGIRVNSVNPGMVVTNLQKVSAPTFSCIQRSTLGCLVHLVLGSAFNQFNETIIYL